MMNSFSKSSFSQIKNIWKQGDFLQGLDKDNCFIMHFDSRFLPRVIIDVICLFGGYVSFHEFFGIQIDKICCICEVIIYRSL